LKPGQKLRLTGGSVRSQGKSLASAAKIELYQGKPQIKLLSINQIKLVDSHPVR